jgi:hypothetical protein
MFIVLFITNIIILLIIKFYLKRRLSIASLYSKSLLKSINDLGYNLGISSLISTILNLLRSKSSTDFSGDTLQYYNKFGSFITDNKISLISKFNLLIILLFFVLLNVVIYRLLQFSLILPIKTLINALFYTILGFDLSSYLDEIYLLYIPYMKQWLNNNLGFSFKLPEYVPEGHAWNLEDIQLVKTFNNGFEILREITNKLSGDDIYYNEIQSMLPESTMEGNSTLPEEGGWNWPRIFGVVVILAGLGFGVYYFYGDSISEYYNGGKPGNSSNTTTTNSTSYNPYNTDIKPLYEGSSVNNVVRGPDNIIKWWWSTRHSAWSNSNIPVNFIPSDLITIVPTGDITPKPSFINLPAQTHTRAGEITPPSHSQYSNYFSLPNVGKSFSEVTKTFAKSTLAAEAKELSINTNLPVDFSVTGELLPDYKLQTPDYKSLSPNWNSPRTPVILTQLAEVKPFSSPLTPSKPLFNKEPVNSWTWGAGTRLSTIVESPVPTNASSTSTSPISTPIEVTTVASKTPIPEIVTTVVD